MMFDPTGFGLNAGQTSVVEDEMDVSAIWITGVAPNIAGPYLPGAGGTIQNVYGIWLGKAVALHPDMHRDQKY